ncbi:MAG: hypothetical protein R3B57_08915 [Phycisphaerales bacterium]
MRSTIPLTVIAVAGLTTAVQAQTKGSVILTASTTSLLIGDLFTIGVYADDDGSTPGVFSFNIAVDVGPNLQIVTGPTVGGAYVFGWAGSMTSTSVEGIGGSTDIFGPTFDAPLNNLLLFNFQVVVVGSPIGLLASSRTGSGPNPALLTASEGGIVLLPTPYNQLNFGSLSIPAPGSAGLFVAGSLLAARRRRR